MVSDYTCISLLEEYKTIGKAHIFFWMLFLCHGGKKKCNLVSARQTINLIFFSVFRIYFSSKITISQMRATFMCGDGTSIGYTWPPAVKRYVVKSLNMHLSSCQHFWQVSFYQLLWSAKCDELLMLLVLISLF